jgi:DNA-binding NarL/FixJ family response regulator
VAEYMCSRALALACIGRADDALSEVDASPQSSAVEPLVLAAIVRAVCAIRSGHTDAVDAVSKLEAIAFGAGAVDLLIIGYRACPEILTILLRTGSDQLRSLVARVGDADLATAVGMPLPADEKRTSLLSPREREVHDLMVQGLKNREIGKLLFIEESTVKAHTHHIYDKLGTHSRRALIVQAMLERSDQATSATESSTPESGS